MVVGCLIDWDILKQIYVLDVIHDLTFAQGWDMFFEIKEATYWELTMEIMSSFKLDRSIINLS